MEPPAPASPAPHSEPPGATLLAGDGLRRLLQGEAEAVDAWFRAEHPAVHRLCLGFLADAAEAEDAAQDAMLLLLDRLPAWDPTRAWAAWRTRLVLNHCRDRLRRVAARRGAERRAGEAALALREVGAAGGLHASGGPEDAAEVRELLASLLGELSPREREAFVLRDLEQRSTADTAEAMGVAEASVRSLLTLARRRLRRRLAPRLGLGSVDAGEGGR